MPKRVYVRDDLQDFAGLLDWVDAALDEEEVHIFVSALVEALENLDAHDFFGTEGYDHLLGWE